MTIPSNFTRRAAFGLGMLKDMSDLAEGVGLGCDIAISQAASAKLAGIAGPHEPEVDFEHQAAWCFRLHESGLLPALDAPGGGLLYRALLNNHGTPVDVALKGVRGRGDFAEPVLTIMLPEEVFEFTGRLISLRAEYVSLLAPFVSTEAGQVPMNCLRVEPAPGGGALLVAMNQHAMGVFHDPDAYCEEPLNLRLPKELLRNCKPKWNDVGQRRIVLDGGKATVEGGGGRVYYIEPEPILEDGTYPNWRAILDSAVSAAASTGGAVPSPLYKAEGLVLFHFQAGQSGGIRLYPTGHERPVVVRNEGYPSFVGVIMPLIGGETAASPRPAWMAADDFESLDGITQAVEAAMIQ